MNNTDDPKDLNGHGTHVAGIIAGKSMGIAPQAKLYALKVMCSQTGINYERVNKALEEALDYNVDIINISLSSSAYDEDCEVICNAARAKGVLIVASAGNNHSGAGFPASYGVPVISVASVTNSKMHAPNSNIWPTNDVCAPGMQIFSCYKDGKYCISGGTSMAAAQITGILSLGVSILKQKGKKVDADRLESILKATAEPLSQRAEEITARYGIAQDLSPEQAIQWIYGSGLARADRFVEEINRI